MIPGSVEFHAQDVGESGRLLQSVGSAQRIAGNAIVTY